MKHNKITKPQAKKFNTGVERLVLSNGFSPCDAFYGWKKDTHFGIVRISTDSQFGSEIYSIFVRFESPEKALNIFNCNKYSGKYNFHFTNGQYCLDQFQSFLCELDSLVEVDKLIQADRLSAQN